MDQCSATKRNGEPCTLPAVGQQGLCWAHDPKNAERRRRGQSRGGKNKPSRQLVAINRRLEELAQQVMDKEVDRSDAAVAGQLLNYVLRGISIGLKAREMEELEQRLEELEASIAHQPDGRSWYGGA